MKVSYIQLPVNKVGTLHECAARNECTYTTCGRYIRIKSLCYFLIITGTALMNFNTGTLCYLFCRVRLIFQADIGLACKKFTFRLPHLSQENPIIKQSKLSM